MYRCRGYSDIQPRGLVSPDDARRFPSIALNFLFRNDVTINARGFIAPQFRGVISSYARSLVTALSSPFVARVPGVPARPVVAAELRSLSGAIWIRNGISKRRDGMINRIEIGSSKIFDFHSELLYPSRTIENRSNHRIKLALQFSTYPHSC